jgi:signal transduction histidine kinase
LPDRGELDEELRRMLPAARVPADSLSRGRRRAGELRTEGEPGTADLIEELCADVEGVRRQITRVGFDLHDEGLQDLTALRNDLYLFRAQISLVLGSSKDRRRVLGRVDDFIARVVSLDGVLRDVAASAGVSPALRRSLSATLEAIVDAYPGPCVVESRLDPALDSHPLTDDLRIALVRVVQSALANALQHSGAKTAFVSVRCHDDGIDAEIVDDGKGFDVKQVLWRAIEEQRLGLLGMQERVRSVGGNFTVTSKVGGPTRIAFSLPIAR